MIDVLLNVYDMSPINSKTSMFGVGVYHSGLEVLGREWSFGQTDTPRSGVFDMAPGGAATDQVTFFKSIHLGSTSLTPAEVRAVIDELSEDFQGLSYNVVKRNCNHFSDTLARRLLGRGIPGWVNRLAFLGSFVSCLLPADLGGPSPQGESGSSSSSSSNGLEGSRLIAAPPRVQAFSGQGMTLGGASSSRQGDTNLDTDLRSVLARSAERRLQQAPKEFE
jgi:hypothetical protein